MLLKSQRERSLSNRDGKRGHILARPPNRIHTFGFYGETFSGQTQRPFAPSPRSTRQVDAALATSFPASSVISHSR